MKYQVDDKFEGKFQIYNETIEITSIVNNLYLTMVINTNSYPFEQRHDDASLDSLCKNGWTFIPKPSSSPPVPTLGANSGWVPGTILGVPPVNYSSNLLPILPFKNAFSDIDLTSNVLSSANEFKCSHSLYEEKVLFTSWYKVCKTCKKEFE